MLSPVLCVAWVTPNAEYQLFPLQMPLCIPGDFLERCCNKRVAFAPTSAPPEFAKKLDYFVMLRIKLRNVNAAFLSPLKMLQCPTPPVACIGCQNQSD